MLEKLKNYIFEGDFDLAKDLCDNMDYGELEHDLIVIAYDTESVVVYFFVLYLISHKNKAELHFIACDLLINPLVDISGAYYIAYEHILKAVEIDSNNQKYKENLLLFYHIPEKLLPKEEAINIAKSILKACPDTTAANSIISEE